MPIKKLWKELPAVHIDTPACDILDHFASADGVPFVPIVDSKDVPLGIVREQDLKIYIYSFFGRELLTRRQLSDFLCSCPVLPANTTVEDLLHLAAEIDNYDGVIFVENEKYRAALSGGALLQLFGKHHLDMQVRVAQLQKMEAVGNLAGGIAHDLNNLLTPIGGCAEMALEMIEDGQIPNVEIVRDIQRCAQRAAETVRRVQSFSRHQTTERGPVHLYDIVEETLRLLESSLPKTIDFKVVRDIPHDTIFGNSAEILQVLMNLCTNAAHAINGECGTIEIGLSKHEGDLKGWNLCKDPLIGEYLDLTIRDNGTGIDPDILPEVFMPFFTTKKQGEGTGMGLAVVHGIVNRARGHISVESELGEGTTFHIVWPLYGVQEEVEMEAQPKKNKEDAIPSAVRAVVVDDEPAITRLAQFWLSRKGYDVIPFTDSLSALHAIENELLPFDILILDQVMPNMTGMELAKRALQLHPDLPIIMCTGYTDAVSPEEAKSIGIKEFLLKPVNFNLIAEAIKRETSVRE